MTGACGFAALGLVGRVVVDYQVLLGLWLACCLVSLGMVLQQLADESELAWRQVPLLNWAVLVGCVAAGPFGIWVQWQVGMGRMRDH